MNMGRAARLGGEHRNPGEWVRHVEIMQTKTQQMRPRGSHGGRESERSRGGEEGWGNQVGGFQR